MKNRIYNASLTAALTAMLMLSAVWVEAQGGGGGPPPPPPPPDPTTAPVDSGCLAFLVAVGAYGYMQLKKKDIV